MGQFADLHPKKRAAERLKTWEGCQELVRRLLTEINDQVFDGAWDLHKHDFDGQRVGLELTDGAYLEPIEFRIRVGVSYDPNVLEVSAEGPGCVEGEWEVANHGAKDLSAEDRLIEGLKKALLYLEPATASMADRQVG